MSLVNSCLLSKQKELLKEIGEYKETMGTTLQSEQNANILQRVGRSTVMPFLNFILMNPIRFLFGLDLRND